MFSINFLTCSLILETRFFEGNLNCVLGGLELGCSTGEGTDSMSTISFFDLTVFCSGQLTTFLSKWEPLKIFDSPDVVLQTTYFPDPLHVKVPEVNKFKIN